MKKISLLIAFLSISFVGLPQVQLSTKKKKAADLYYEADNYWVRGQFATASELLKQAVSKDDEFYEAYFRLGVIEKAKGNTHEAEEYLLKTLSIKHDHAGANFELGELYIQMGEYEKSLNHTQNYLDLNPRNSKRKAQAESFIESANYAIKNIKIKSSLNPEPLPPHINQYAMQYFPIITADERHLLYTRRLGTTMNDDEDLVIAEKEDNGEWGEPHSISENINSSFNEGTCTISADGRILIFTSCYGRKGYGSCDLYISKKSGDKWSVPVNLGPNVNSSAWDSQPSLSADGRVLYFVSNRPHGIGQRDLWVSYLDDNEEWGKPENLGPLVNTKGDEVSPFIHPNNSTLFFSSNGRKGFGGFDIYFSKIGNEGWSEPKNIGYPINTGEDQVSLFITADGTKGYYSHENLENPDVKGELYRFDIPKELQIEEKASYVRGRVYDQKTNQSLGAQIELYDVEKNKRIAKVSADSLNGQYLMVLPEGSEYAFYVNKKGYLFKSLSFNYRGETFEPLEIDIPLNPIEAGTKTVLKNIFFEFDKYEVQPASHTELNKVVGFMKENPDLSVEISGHTDNQGSIAYNQQLSEKRAHAVYNYLIEKGVPKLRLKYKGYGQQFPIASNETEEGRRQNRRIEFEIIN